MQSIIKWLQTFFSGPRDFMTLREYSLFSELSSYDLFMLNDLIHTREFSRGETIFESGYPLEVIYLIRSGDIDLMGVYGGKQNRVLSKGEHLGLLDLFYNQQRNSTAIASTDVSVHAISRSDLQDFIRFRPKSGVKILTAINKEFCRFVFEQAAVKEHELD